MLSQASKIAMKLHKLYGNQFTKAQMDYEVKVLNTYLDRCIINIKEPELNHKRHSEYNSTEPSIKIPNDEERCCARVWDINNLKTVSKTTGAYINYGRRCNRPRHKNNDYCKMHIKKNSHGDYRLSNVPIQLKQHFEKAVVKYGDSSIIYN